MNGAATSTVKRDKLLVQKIPNLKMSLVQEEISVF